jgi:diguanylate cyclase (GGDEF)-like protein
MMCHKRLSCAALWHGVRLYDVIMDGYFSGDDASVSMSARQRQASRQNTSKSHHDRRDLAAGAVLLSHWRPRIFTALVIAVLQLGLLHRVDASTGLDRTTVGILSTVVGYILLVSLLNLSVRRRGRAAPWRVTLTLISDLLYVYGLTLTATTPEHYERALFGTIVIMNVANYFYGARQSWRVVQFGIAGYVVLIASAVALGLRVDVAEEVWTLVLCAAGISLILFQSGDVRRRLRTIVRLFEHAEQGDFSREYDAASDSRPDAITRVGLAYNAVRAQLASMVLTDPLTSCLNRRGFDQALNREIGRAARAGNEFSLLAVDLDHFKHVNDTYGHLAGDDLLRAMGALLVNSGRIGDVVARVGGEEFAILLADTGLAGAQLFANRLCERIRSHGFVIGSSGDCVAITTSIGVAVGNPRGVPDFAELLWSRSDDALYAAKRAGRDCVRAWNADIKHSGQHVAIGSHS